MAAERRCAFSCQKAISTGFSSGEYFGRYRNHAPRLAGASFGTLAVVDAEIVEENDIARRECRGELGLDINLKGSSVHGPVNDPWGGEFAAAQAPYEGLCAPFSERRSCPQALAAQGPAAKVAHVRLH